jgi:hypothetical protein
MPVARKLWLPSLVLMPAAAARRRIIAISIRLGQHRAGLLAGAAADRAEQRPFGIIAQTGAVEISD